MVFAKSSHITKSALNFLTNFFGHRADSVLSASKMKPKGQNQKWNSIFPLTLLAEFGLRSKSV